MASVWRALETGLEQMPPLAHVVSRTAYRLAGGGAFAIRLPSVLGFSVMAACLYAFLRKRLPAPYALAGMLVPFLTGALHYGYEGRSYGFVLGCAGIAIVAWQRAEGPRRPLALAALALACAAAVSSHYYAVLIPMPIALGELVRTLQRRRLDPWVWAALAFSAVPLVFFLPLIRSARHYSKAFWAKPSASSVLDAYGSLLIVAIPFLVIFALLWVGYFVSTRNRTVEIDTRGFAPDLALAGGFLALPLAAVALSFFTGVFTPRYAVWGILGIALCIAFLGYLGTGGSRAFGRIAALYLLAVFAFLQVFELRRVSAKHPAALDALKSMPATNLPIVYADPLNYLQAAYYAGSPLKERLYYLTDTDAALRHAGTDSPERALSLLAQLTPLRIAALRDFTTAHRRFFVLESGEFGWLVPELTERGATLVVREAPADTKLYEVFLDPAEVAVPATSAPSGRPPPEQSRLQPR